MKKLMVLVVVVAGAAVASAQAKLPKKLTQSDIMRVVVKHKPAIVKCVNESKKQAPDVSGKLVMRWTIQPSGKTTAISVRTAELRKTTFARCMTGLVRGWTFPKHQVQGPPVDFPFTF